MNRRYFLQNSVAAAAAPQTPPVARETEAGGTGSTSYQARVQVERRQSGAPHKGKVFAAIQPPHASIFDHSPSQPLPTNNGGIIP